MEATSWWHGRIVAGLASYWVYQHLGNMSPAERAADEIWREIAAHTGETELDLTARLDERMRGGFRHLLVGTSLPFLLPPGLHHLESWDEAVSTGAWGRPAARVGERLRRLVDLEHWAAFERSFRQLARMATEVADGRRGPAPQTVTFLSGDVHYSTVSEVQRATGSRIVQAVCSPIRNPLPIIKRSFENRGHGVLANTEMNEIPAGVGRRNGRARNGHVDGAAQVGRSAPERQRWRQRLNDLAVGLATCRQPSPATAQTVHQQPPELQRSDQHRHRW
ncbi:hypothetical protein [Cryobacterium sp. TMT1-66-1]|uniref:hypothetical protein n=1 Tax=Cryobacterium sp. TMT1-66-1 TaxID=1259242 RepID=UPI00351A6511